MSVYARTFDWNEEKSFFDFAAVNRYAGNFPAEKLFRSVAGTAAGGAIAASDNPFICVLLSLVIYPR